MYIHAHMHGFMNFMDLQLYVYTYIFTEDEIGEEYGLGWREG